MAVIKNYFKRVDYNLIINNKKIIKTTDVHLLHYNNLTEIVANYLYQNYPHLRPLFDANKLKKEPFTPFKQLLTGVEDCLNLGELEQLLNENLIENSFKVLNANASAIGFFCLFTEQPQEILYKVWNDQHNAYASLCVSPLEPMEQIPASRIKINSDAELILEKRIKIIEILSQLKINKARDLPTGHYEALKEVAENLDEAHNLLKQHLTRAHKIIVRGYPFNV